MINRIMIGFLLMATIIYPQSQVGAWQYFIPGRPDLHVPIPQSTTPLDPIIINEIFISYDPGLSLFSRKSSITLSNDGTATYTGYPGGTYQAVLPRKQYARLAKLVKDAKFSEMFPFYGSAGSFDAAKFTVSIIWNGKRITVIDGGQSSEPSPSKILIEIEHQLYRLVKHTRWKKIRDTEYIPDYLPKLSKLVESIDKAKQ